MLSIRTSAVPVLGAVLSAALVGAFVLASSLPFSGEALAQESPATPPSLPGITVVGDGVIPARPNTTTVQLGVQVTASSPAEALAQARQRTEAVLQRLRERGVPETDLQTSGLNVNPNFGPGRDPSAQPAVTGYNGSASITVQVADVNRVGELLTAAVDAGANLVHGLSYGLRDDAALRRQAILAAIADARPKAEAVAQATGLALGPVRAVVEVPLGTPPGLFRGGLGGGASEGIAPGELSVTSRVQVTFDVTR